MHREMRESRALAECVPDSVQWNLIRLGAFAKEAAGRSVTVVGMDDPLVGGLVDEMEAAGLRGPLGPRKNAAILEGSKAFSKVSDEEIQHSDSSRMRILTDPTEGSLRISEMEAEFPIVLKAVLDWLLGKGVSIVQCIPEEAEDGVRTVMQDKKFGTAGNTMVIEEFMTGQGSIRTIFLGRWERPSNP